MKQAKKQSSNKSRKYVKPAIEMHGKITDMVLTVYRDNGGLQPSRPQEL